MAAHITVVPTTIFLLSGRNPGVELAPMAMCGLMLLAANRFDKAAVELFSSFLDYIFSAEETTTKSAVDAQTVARFVRPPEATTSQDKCALPAAVTEGVIDREKGSRQ